MTAHFLLAEMTFNESVAGRSKVTKIWLCPMYADVNFFPPDTIASKNQAGMDWASEKEVPAPVIVLAPESVLSHFSTWVSIEWICCSILIDPIWTCSLKTSSSLLLTSPMNDLVQAATSGAYKAASKYLPTLWPTICIPPWNLAVVPTLLTLFLA